MFRLQYLSTSPNRLKPGLLLTCIYLGVCIMCLNSLVWAGKTQVSQTVQGIELKYSEGLEAATVWPDEVMKKRFVQYWTKRFSGDPAAELMSFEAPHFQYMISMKRYQMYLNNFPKGNLTKIVCYNPVKLTEYYYEIPIQVNYMHQKSEAKSFGMKDRWVQVQGQWYHLQRDPMFFPSLSSH